MRDLCCAAHDRIHPALHGYGAPGAVAPASLPEPPLLERQSEARRDQDHAPGLRSRSALDAGAPRRSAGTVAYYVSGRTGLSGKKNMLILIRVGETLMIGDDVTITVLGVKGNQVRVGINAPRSIAVHREEIYERIKREQTAATLRQAQP